MAPIASVAHCRQNQYEYISQKIKENNLGAKIKVYLKDYRQVQGVFDKFVSIGMFEHVGKKLLSGFFFNG
jgi:cyclopropane-fatty-acyl-phospholipid synthase (EC 2.1.1.79)